MKQAEFEEKMKKLVAPIIEEMYKLLVEKDDPEAWREEYRKKQEAGVKYEACGDGKGWEQQFCYFHDKKEEYREVPQQPHAAERALWKAQMDAGTNEVWQAQNPPFGNGIWTDLRADTEPQWAEKAIYRVKPKPAKLTAKIVRSELYAMVNPLVWSRDWEFYGTPEEYRAECEKYGYLVVSDITEVKLKTVKHYFALMQDCSISEFTVKLRSSKEHLMSFAERNNLTIIGNIEEREVPVE